MKIIFLEQGTEEWLAYRKTKIGASDAPIILQKSPYGTPLTLWEEKKGKREGQVANKAHAFGHKIERQVREWYNHTYDVDCQPLVIESEEKDYMMSSLDGWDIVTRRAIEIKANNWKKHHLAVQNKVCDMHFWQLQHQMFCLDQEKIEYLSFYEGETRIVEVYRNESAIRTLLEKEEAFWSCLEENKEPEREEYEKLEDKESLAMLVYETQKKAKEKEEEFKQTKAQADLLLGKLLEVCRGQPFDTDSWCLEKKERRGSLKVSAIQEYLQRYHPNLSLNWEQFRGEAVTSWKLGLKE